MRSSKTRIALIDYENIGSLEGVSLHDFDKVLFFTGAKQENIKIPVTSLSSAISVCIIPATEVSKNNVDFHLVLELGQLIALSGDTSHFSVISRDKGYDGIISRLKAAGISCTRLSPALPAPQPVKDTASTMKVMKAKEHDMGYWINRLKLSCASSPKSLPATPKGLQNYLSNVTGQKSCSLLNERIKQELIRLGFITIYEKTLVWNRSLHSPAQKNRRAVLQQVK
ncbi:TPA: NYN domain-containing protein [Escherichia coli]|uniref:PIN domain-containing protein n=1 Tax=Klebsiella pneumoniae complex TaxID=3390273 RepID=UPI00077FAC97|nr:MULTISPECIES: PIN domain-containing protein [Klebsiella]MDI7070859.1 PIN domain-containing protein [Pseudomonas aeruginosa]HAT7687493.1 NYN domain-containing protein [Enterobacter cloacae subsp. cloacae]HBM7804002.1 NYN domain-containing protein [Escherichia coli]EKV8137041.1 NYN domain-containing protein [Klebsiella pneumoniae]EKW8954985.1 NYN domain-containing protein [Klebsiella pneumoniae]